MRASTPRSFQRITNRLLLEALVEITCFASLCVPYTSCGFLPGHPPCAFNLLCTCSGGSVPDLGLVRCRDVPMVKPPTFNNTKVHGLLLDSNRMRLMELAQFAGSGIQTLEIKNNLFTRIPDDAFHGLEGSLRNLDLGSNHLHYFPRQAIRPLFRLQHLDLSGNFLHTILKEDFRGMEKSLKSLLLRNNYLTQLTQDIFTHLRALELLSLSGNRMSFLSDSAFRSAPQQFQRLDLSNNAFTTIPYIALATLKNAKEINLSRNGITSLDNDLIPTALANKQNSASLKLVLDENQIKSLSPGAFRHFPNVKHVSLSGNPIHTLADNAFQGTKVSEIHLQRCDLIHLASGVFKGLENHLKILDLNYNHLNGSAIAGAVASLTVLENLLLNGNTLTPNTPNHLPKNYSRNFQSSLQELQLGPDELKSRQYQKSKGGGLTHNELRGYKSLRSFHMSEFPETTLYGQEFEFLGAGSALQKLVLGGSNLKFLKADCFRFLPSLKSLDLSSNRLEYVNEHVFRSVGHSLERLSLGRALHSSMDRLPNRFLHPLISLQHLDLSNNKLKYLTCTVIEHLAELRFLNLQDNALEALEPCTFQGQQQSKLETVKLSFNDIPTLLPKTFCNLEQLRYLYVDNNAIRSVQQAAIADLNRLQYLDLEGNRIETMDTEAIQNLPNLEVLDLAHNRLQNFSFKSLDRVGTLAKHLKLNLSHNAIQGLTAANTTALSMWQSTNVNVKVLDLSYNNISQMDHSWFASIASFLMELDLSYNTLGDVTRSMIGEFPYLQILKLSGNHLEKIEADSFHNTPSLQTLLLDHNAISILPAELLSKNAMLKHLDLSHNMLEFLPDGFFEHNVHLQELDLSFNNLTRPNPNPIPTLQTLDLSHNNILLIPTEVMKGYPELSWLDLSYNDLREWTVNHVLNKSRSLYFLDLSDNPFETISDEPIGENVHGIEILRLSNVGLTTMPELKLPNLLHLNLSRNSMSVIPTTSMIHAKEIRLLDISSNNFSSAPKNIWPLLPNLLELHMARNPLDIISSDALIGLGPLDLLDIRGSPEQAMQHGALSGLQNLRKLQIDIQRNTESLLYFARAAISNLQALETVHLNQLPDFDFQSGSLEYENLENRLPPLPPKLTNVFISGQNLHSFHHISRAFLKGFRNRHLYLSVKNASAASIQRTLFQSLESVHYLRLDITHNAFHTLANTVGGSEWVAGRLLEALKVAGNPWQCDCQIGWMEHWMRGWRQRECSYQELPEAHQKCKRMVTDFRLAQCFNMNNKSLIDALKEDLECYGASAALTLTVPAAFNIAAITSWTIIYWTILQHY